MKIKRQLIDDKMMYIGTIEKYPDIKIFGDDCVSVANNLQELINIKEKCKNESTK